MQIKNTISNLKLQVLSILKRMRNFFFIIISTFIVISLLILGLSSKPSKIESNEPTISPMEQLRIDRSNARFEAMQKIQEDCNLSRKISAEELKAYTDKKLENPAYEDEKLTAWSEYMQKNCNELEVDFL